MSNSSKTSTSSSTTTTPDTTTTETPLNLANAYIGDLKVIHKVCKHRADACAATLALLGDKAARELLGEEQFTLLTGFHDATKKLVEDFPLGLIPPPRKKRK